MVSRLQTTKVVSEFDGPGGSINESLAGLILNTHYRGTLTVRRIGSVDAPIDFRHQRAALHCPSGHRRFQIGSIAADSAVVGYMSDGR
jgi:hypothetical protein